MSEKTTAASQLKNIALVLSQRPRWIILRELAKGEALPVMEIARRAGCSRPMGTKHMAVLRAAGLVVSGYGRLYSLAPAYRPAPGATTLDLGPCLLKLTPPEPSAPA